MTILKKSWNFIVIFEFYFIVIKNFWVSLCQVKHRIWLLVPNITKGDLHSKFLVVSLDVNIQMYNHCTSTCTSHNYVIVNYIYIKWDLLILNTQNYCVTANNYPLVFYILCILNCLDCTFFCLAAFQLHCIYKTHVHQGFYKNGYLFRKW